MNSDSKDIIEKVSKISNDNYIIIIGKIPFTISLKANDKTFSINIKRQLSPNFYEGIFTYEDLLNKSKFLMLFGDLNKIKNLFVSKIENRCFSLKEECDSLMFITEIKIENFTEEIKLIIPKDNNMDLNAYIDDVSKSLIYLTERVDLIEKQLEKTNKFDSVIVEENEKPLIFEWLKGKKRLKLIYRSTLHGKSAKAFHTECDNIAETITFIETTNGKKFGGFTKHKWDSSGAYKPFDSDAFLFSLDKKKKMEILLNNNNTIYCNGGYGPTFGGGHDIYISANFDGQCYVNKNSYQQESQYYLTDGNYNFTPKEIEVYKVRDF